MHEEGCHCCQHQRVNPVRNWTDLPLSLSSPFLVDSCGFSIATLLTGVIVRIFVVTLPLTTPSWPRRLLAPTAAHGRQRCQAQKRASNSSHVSPLSWSLSRRPSLHSSPPIYVFLIVPHASALSLKHLSGVDLGYGFSAQTWPPSPRQYFLND